MYAVVGLSTPRGLVHPRPHTADPPPSPLTSGTGDVTLATVGRACATRTTCCRLGPNVAFSSRSKLDERDARLAVCIQHRRIYVCWPHDSVTVFGSQEHRHHMCTPLKATFHYAIKVVGLVCDLDSVMEFGFYRLSFWSILSHLFMAAHTNGQAINFLPCGFFYLLSIFFLA